MLKKLFSGLMLTILLTSMSILALRIQPVKSEPITWTVDDDGPADFHTITDAIAAASSGDTIYVYSGTYHEHLYITKSLEIIGESKNDTIIDGDGVASVVRIRGPDVAVAFHGFTVMNSGWLSNWASNSIILVNEAQGCNISNNILADGRYGITVSSSQKNAICENTVSATNQGIVIDSSLNNNVVGNTVSDGVWVDDAPPYGIHLWSASTNTVVDNIIFDMNYTGIRLDGTLTRYSYVKGNIISNCSDGIVAAGGPSYYNTIIENIMSNTTWGIAFFENSYYNSIIGNSITNSTNSGIHIQGGGMNEIIGNTLLSNNYGIDVGISHDNEISDNKVIDCTNEGIMIGESFSNTITNNTITESNIAIYLGDSYSNDISENTAMSNAWGIWLVDSEENEVYYNKITNNNGGILILGADSSSNIIRGNIIQNTTNVQNAIFLHTCNNNSICHNDFVGNALPQIFNYASVNVWDDGYPSGGNYWSDYAGVDADSDGIGDTPYVIDGSNQDDYPLMNSWSEPWGNWSHYHNYMQIVRTLLYLNETYPNIVDMFSIGKSWLDQDIYCIRLTNEDIAHPKPKLFFVGYHHARELISAELPLYFAVEAAAEFGINVSITHMLNYSEVYIVPALNVDAFNAMAANEWQRKNVHPYDEDDDAMLDEDPPDDEDDDGYIEDLFYWDGVDYYFIRWEGVDDDSDGSFNEDWIGGVDPNRNYGYQWNASCQSGSPYPWAEDYRGPAPFSEPETQAIRDLALAHNFKYALSFHSGTEVIIYPWCYTNTPTPHDSLFREIASNLSSLTGAPYAQSGSGLYTSSGSWDDWMYGNRSSFALTCEIYGNDTAWQYEPGPEPYTWWEKGVFQFFNPSTTDIEAVVQRWLPVFNYTINRAITEAYDLATNNVVPSKTVVGEGFTMKVNVTVTNQGEFTETFNVTTYANGTVIQAKTITLTSKNSATITFTWNTTGCTKGDYRISAVAKPIPGETATADNTFAYDWVMVKTPGNINGDGTINFLDAILLGAAFGSAPNDPNWNANADINCDEYINFLDAIILGANFGATDP